MVEERIYDPRDYRYKEKKQKKRRVVIGGIRKIFKRKRIGGRRVTKRRQVATKRLLAAAGVLGGGPTQTGPGRPRGTFKYGVPIQEYKRLQARKRALYDVYKQEEIKQLSRRGLTRRQIQTAQTVRTLEQPKTPTSVADDELAFRKFLAKRTISPNTQAILTRLRRTQLKAQSDDVEMQRRLRERKMVAGAGSLLNTPFIFKEHQMDITGVDEDNILNAPNTFKENPEDNILRQKRWSVMQTREAGNSLNFF